MEAVRNRRIADIMLSSILIVIACVTSTHGQEGDIVDKADNKTQCINQLVQWCNNMQYSQQGIGLTVLSIAYSDPNGYYRIFCSSDSDGTNCTRNRASWFTCSPDHVLTYKGQVLTTDFSTSVDDGICETADKAFNDLFIQNLSYDNTTLNLKTEVQKDMEAFFEQMQAMAEQLDLIQKMMRERPPLIDDFWDGFDGGVKFHRPNPDLVTDVPDEKQTGQTERPNQIERE